VYDYILVMYICIHNIRVNTKIIQMLALTLTGTGNINILKIL